MYVNQIIPRMMWNLTRIEYSVTNIFFICSIEYGYDQKD